MSDAYHQLLDATIAHLEELKSSGRRFVPVSTETLAGLNASPAARPKLSVPSIPGAAPAPPARPIQTARAVTPTAPPVPMVIAPVTNPAERTAKESAMAQLRERAMACVKCPNLVAARQNVVFGVGDVHSPLLFVGEAPGADEDRQGEPFVGAAGQLLTKIIETMGLSRSTVYIANILKCRPDVPAGAPGNRKPTPNEMNTCKPYLLEQIDLIKPRVIVALGGTAVEGLLGVTTGITKLRGTWSSFQGVPLMPTFHPSYLLRNQSLDEKRRVWEDMLQVMEKLGMPITDRQRNFFLRSPGSA